jgi:8-oxo-dGTP diphosphatase
VHIPSLVYGSNKLTNSTIEVVAAVVERDGRYLICQRPLNKRHGGLWEFPGGKLQSGESLFDAAYRELSEELNLRVTTIHETVFSIADDGSNFVIHFVPAVTEGEPSLLEHSDCRWVTLQELSDLPLAPSDAVFVHYLSRSQIRGIR